MIVFVVDDDVYVDDIVVEFVYRYAGYACAGIRSTTYQWTKQATHALTCIVRSEQYM